MERKTKTALTIISLSLVFIVSATFSFHLYPENSGITSYSENNETISHPENSTFDNLVLGENSKGSVSREGPYGDMNSPVKIAYIVGVHPLESKSHQAMVDTIKSQNNTLERCYYIYFVNVTADADDYGTGRMNGQLLAKDYVVPDIKKEKFDLAIDVHSNVGNWDESWFIFAPVKGSEAEKIALQITEKLPWLEYYVPPNPTSPQYVTQPLIKAGIPAVIYEAYVQDSLEVMKQRADEFVKTVDGMEIGNRK